MQHHDESQNIMLKERSQTQKTMLFHLYEALEKIFIAGDGNY